MEEPIMWAQQTGPIEVGMLHYCLPLRLAHVKVVI